MSSELSSFTSGQVQACFACLFALIRTHPDPQGLNAMLGITKQAFIAKLTNQEIPDSVLEGFHDAFERFESTAASALKNQRGP